VSKCYNQAKINDFNYPSIDMAFGRAINEQDMPKDKDEAMKQFYEEFKVPQFESKEQVEELVGVTPEDFQQPDWLAKRELARERKAGEPTSNPPELQQLARERVEGNVTTKDWIDAVREINRPTPFNKIQDVPTYKQMVMALQKPYNGIINTGGNAKPGMTKIKTGYRVASRLDIPAYRDNDVWVVTVHVPQSGKAGSVIGYAKSSHLKNVTFQEGGRQMKGAMKIASGEMNKYPMATFIGDWQNTSTESLVKKTKDAFKSGDWVEIGMNPNRGEFFYDKYTFQPVASAGEVYQIGPLLLAKDVVYMNPNLM